MRQQKRQHVAGAAIHAGDADQGAQFGFGAGGIAWALSIHQGDRVIQACSGPVRLPDRDHVERRDRGLEVELPHQGYTAVVAVSTRSAVTGAPGGCPARSTTAGASAPPARHQLGSGDTRSRATRHPPIGPQRMSPMRDSVRTHCARWHCMASLSSVGSRRCCWSTRRISPWPPRPPCSTWRNVLLHVVPAFLWAAAAVCLRDPPWPGGRPALASALALTVGGRARGGPHLARQPRRDAMGARHHVIAGGVAVARAAASRLADATRGLAAATIRVVLRVSLRTAGWGVFAAWLGLGVRPVAPDRIVNPLTPPPRWTKRAPGRRRRSSLRPPETNVGGTIPSDFFLDSELCGDCHKDVYEQWKGSVHHFASFNNQFYRKSIEYMQSVVGTRPSKWCAGCHDHAVFFNGRFERRSPSRSTRPKRRRAWPARPATPSRTSTARWAMAGSRSPIHRCTGWPRAATVIAPRIASSRISIPNRIAARS